MDNSLGEQFSRNYPEIIVKLEFSFGLVRKCPTSVRVVHPIRQPSMDAFASQYERIHFLFDQSKTNILCICSSQNYSNPNLVVGLCISLWIRRIQESPYSYQTYYCTFWTCLGLFEFNLVYEVGKEDEEEAN